MESFRNVRVVTICGVMAALGVALSFVASIDIGPYIRIGFSGIPNQIIACLFGPAVGAVFGAALDILKFVVKPTGMFFPGFTVSAALGGMIYGMVLHRKQPTLWRVFLSQLLVKVIVNLFFNTLWLKLLYGKGFFAILPGRILSNAIMLPIDTAIMFLILRLCSKPLMTFLQEEKP